MPEHESSPAKNGGQDDKENGDDTLNESNAENVDHGERVR